MIALTAFHCWQVAWQMGGEWRREGGGWDWSQCREPGRLGEGRRTGERGQGIGSWKGASASFAVEVESGDFGGGREEAAQVFVLQGGPEALETPSSASAAPQTCHLHVCLSCLHISCLGRASLPGPFASAAGNIEAFLGKK